MTAVLPIPLARDTDSVGNFNTHPERLRQCGTSRRIAKALGCRPPQSRRVDHEQLRLVSSRPGLVISQEQLNHSHAVEITFW